MHPLGDARTLRFFWTQVAFLTLMSASHAARGDLEWFLFDALVVLLAVLALAALQRLKENEKGKSR